MHQIIQDNFDLQKIAASGQCFRLHQVEKDCFKLTAGERELTIWNTAPEHFLFSCSKKEFEKIWKSYFDLDTDYGFFERAVPKEDHFLTEAVRYGKGMRILRQDPWEMLVTFIISQRKNIPAIMRAVETLCERYGKCLEKSFGFPTPEALASVTESQLRECSLGYRAGYIKKAAVMVQEKQLDLEELNSQSNEIMLERLIRVPGVGKKVANCIMLFGYHRIEAFPIDVWIDRVIENEYGGQFPLDRYQGFAGVIQQYLFYYGRNGRKN